LLEPFRVLQKRNCSQNAMHPLMEFGIEYHCVSKSTRLLTAPSSGKSLLRSLEVVMSCNRLSGLFFLHFCLKFDLMSFTVPKFSFWDAMNRICSWVLILNQLNFVLTHGSTSHANRRNRKWHSHIQKWPTN